ncbi:hypothetical protein Lal_00001837 [Lupinus albus]|nr:hypothetical protein Lal_00001837 [Lupinus albus]
MVKIPSMLKKSCSVWLLFCYEWGKILRLEETKENLTKLPNSNANGYLGEGAPLELVDGKYVTIVKGKLITLNEELFLKFGGLTSDGSSLGDCNNKLELTTVEILGEDENAIPAEQTQASQPNETPTMPQEPSFGLTQLDDMEQRLNEHINNGMQAMDNRMQSIEEILMVEFHRKKLETHTRLEHLSFMFNTCSDFFQPPPSS